jgi:hypothetical protein
LGVTEHSSGPGFFKLKLGDPVSRVKELLGPPDDVLVNDPEPYSIQANTAWCYGTEGHLTFPTLVKVSFEDGKVVHDYWNYVNEPFDESLLPDSKLLPLLRFIDREKRAMDKLELGEQKGSLQLIRIANKLIALGGPKALSTLREYERATDSDTNVLVPVLLILLTVPSKTGYVDVPSPGVAYPPLPFKRASSPRFPIFLIDDIPFWEAIPPNVGGAYRFDTVNFLFGLDSKTPIRSRLLRPPDDPFPSLKHLLSSKLWPYPAGPNAPNTSWSRAFPEAAPTNEIQDMVMSMISPASMGFPNAPDMSDVGFKKLHKEFIRAGGHWDPKLQDYVRRSSDKRS